MNSDARQQPSDDVHHLTIMWGVCCTSPIVYLAAAALFHRSFMDGGYFPVQADLWKNLLIGLALWCVILQIFHLVIKHRYRPLLEKAAADSAAYLKALTRRPMILIALSELAVFAGFCLFLCQGDIMPVFGGGIVAMLLYGQSHPRAANPVR